MNAMTEESDAPAQILLGNETYTIHYLNAEPDEGFPGWMAMSLVIRNSDGLLLPAEVSEFPFSYLSPMLKGFGASALDAFDDLRDKLSEDLATPYVSVSARDRIPPPIPYFSHLPPPEEATIRVLDHMDNFRSNGTKNGSLTLNAMEAPSARLSCNIAFASVGIDFDLTIIVPSVQRPDPRLPVRPVRWKVWEYPAERKLLMKRMGTDAAPCHPPAPPQLASAVAEIAAQPFDRRDWFDSPGALVVKSSPTAVQLLGLMAHPPALGTFAPPLPISASAPLWVRRVQLVAAFALGQIDLEVDWSRSLRREALLDLMFGPLDWTNDAAIQTLTEIAIRFPEVEEEVMTEFVERLKHVPSPGHVCFLHPLICCLQQLPRLPDDWRTHFADYQRQLESE